MKGEFTILVQDVDSIIYLGLKPTHCTGPGWSQLIVATLAPLSVFQQCTRPSVDPLNTNCESGLNDTSKGIPFVFVCP